MSMYSLWAIVSVVSTLQGLPEINPHSLTPVPIQQVVIDDTFWSPKIKVWREITIPDCFDKFEKNNGNAFDNFDRVREGRLGEYSGPAWHDGLIYEMIRGSADFLAAQRNPELEKRLDGYIDRISAAAAKDPDGYLNTWTQLMAPDKRWGLNGGNDVEQHDLYNAGAMVEAGVHYYRATGKTVLLKTATRFANYMADIMGPPPKQNIVPGHSLPEEALVKLCLLYREHPELKKEMPFPVEEDRFLHLAEFWIENRGNHEGGRSFGRFDGVYAQDHQPVLQQETIEGHAVRATLLCTGIAAAAKVNGRRDYLVAAERLWENMVYRRMYIIGGLGAVAGYEGFGPDYVLPNNGYLETCAAIGAAFFHGNMHWAMGDARYTDELERVLYNAILPGVSLQGNTYFYENPLEAGPKRERWSWHGCPCCPPMFLKIMGALPGYLYAQDDDAIYADLFIGSRAEITLHGTRIGIRQTTRYPWEGTMTWTLTPEKPTPFAFCVRIPSWSDDFQVLVNGKTLESPQKDRGYVRIERSWASGDRVELSLPLGIHRVKAHPGVEADIGRIALQRGPLVYCLESLDNNGEVRNLAISPTALLKEQYAADMLGGITTLHGTALVRKNAEWPADTLYAFSEKAPDTKECDFVAIPYFANANRGPCEMILWIPEEASQAAPKPGVSGNNGTAKQES